MMRLADLRPRWLANGYNQHAVLIFQCPCCRKIWLTCTLEALSMANQCRILERDLEARAEDLHDVVPCKTLAWQASGVPDFDRLTISPSIDASRAGHWHGHITQGVIVG